jgi:hypothetical protein
MTVVRLRFPEEQGRLGPLRSLAIPRLLLVSAGTPPPTCPDPLEDWIWRSASEQDRRQRAAALELRAIGRMRPPTLDEKGCLEFNGRRVPLSPAATVLATQLAARFGEVVERSVMTRALWPRGGCRPRTLDMHILKLRRRVTDVGLEIETIRSRGWLMRTAALERPRQRVNS